MPGQLLVTKGANAFIPEALPTAKMRWFLVLTLVAWLFRKLAGGLWVGGTVCLYEDCLRFDANAANRLLHKENHMVEIALVDVRGVALRRAFVTNIIDVTYAAGRFSFRVFDAREMAAAIQTAVASAQRKPLDEKGSIKIN